MSRAERVEAAAQAMEPIRWVSIAPPPGEYGGSVAQNDSETLATAALFASDALLRTDEAVERVARALADRWTFGVEDGTYEEQARAAINALLGEGE